MPDLEPGVVFTPSTATAMEWFNSPQTAKPAMSKQHKATPKQWAALEEMSAPEYDSIILELHSRVEELEVDQLEQAESNRICFDAIVRRVEALEARDREESLVTSLAAPAETPSPAGSPVERVGPTDEDLLEIRDGAYCPAADEVNDEDDCMWKYTSDYIEWLYTNGTIQEQQKYEAKGLRAVFNAGRRAAHDLEQEVTR